jgi:ElaB/YqjD/DUF883 family membrane-anchored ribosome-binding protein
MTPSHTEHGTGFADAVARSAERAVQSTQRGANEALDSLSSAVEDARRKSGPMLDEAGDRIASLADQGAEALRGTTHAVRERARHASDATLDYIRNEPLRAVLIAAATGAVLMALISLMRNSRH